MSSDINGSLDKRYNTVEDLPQDLSKNCNAGCSLSCPETRKLNERIGNLASCQKDIQEIKALLVSLKQNSQINSSLKVDTLLLSLDTRVSRVERQMEATLNTLGSLVKIQSSMNAAFQQLRSEMCQKLQSLCDEVKAAGITVNHCQ